MKTKCTTFVCCFFIGVFFAQGQTLLQELQKIKDTVYPVQATFKTTRIALGHSIETRKKNISQISIRSRYWNLPKGVVANSFVADKASMRFGVDYAFTNRITAGAGFTSFDGIIDLFTKVRLLEQTPNKKWISITGVQSGSYRTKGFNGVTLNEEFGQRLAFTTQILLARKFSKNLSFQLAPTFIYRSSSSDPRDEQAHFALGLGGRYRIKNHVSIVSEYYWLFNELSSRQTFGAFAIGVNWEIGDVILQFTLTNTLNFVEDTFITQSARNFNLRNEVLAFGFQANYVLHW